MSMYNSNSHLIYKKTCFLVYLSGAPTLYFTLEPPIPKSAPVSIGNLCFEIF